MFDLPTTSTTKRIPPSENKVFFSAQENISASTSQT